MKKHTLFSVLISTLAIGTPLVLDGCVSPPNKDQKAGAGGVMSWEDVDDSMNEHITGERYRVVYDATDAYKGGTAPLVTIIEFSDFQCPYCVKLTDTLTAVAKEYPDDVAVVFKQFPLKMHKDAMPASQAMLAAFGQDRDKGWALHDKMFANAKALSAENIATYATEVGVPDVEKLKKELADETHKAAVDEDMALGMKFAVRSTPSFFVNGRPMRGALPIEKLRELIEEEKKFAQGLIDKGAKREEIYARILRAAKDTREAPKQEQKQRPGQPDAAVNYAVPVDDRPTWGKEDALVTIIEYSDFQCPYCKKVLASVDEVKKAYPDDVRIVFRHQPLPMHAQAPAAARASLAAHKQGKFWEMHDAMFENPKELGDEKLAELASNIGLDTAKWKADFASKEVADMLAQDQKVASQFGAGGTPAFFVNGRFLSGAQGFDAFDKLIKEEKAKAEKFMAEKKVAKKDLYAEMIKGFEKELKVPPAPPPADFKRRDVSVKDLPGKGKLANPKITIVECSDFDCPYCKRGAGTVEEVLKEYGDKVAVYFRHYPLPMHKQAEPAHRAAVAAGNQGKFWEMHDKLFEDKSKRAEADYVAFATELGLDVAQFQTDWAAEATAQKVKDDIAVCQGLEVRGAPGFLINGRLMSGAQPFPRFKEVLDEELAGGFEATQKKAIAKDGKDGKDAKAGGKAAPTEAKKPTPKPEAG